MRFAAFCRTISASENAYKFVRGDDDETFNSDHTCSVTAFIWQSPHGQQTGYATVVGAVIAYRRMKSVGVKGTQVRKWGWVLSKKMGWVLQ